MHWAKKRELTPEEVMKLPPETEVHLEGRDRHGELTWLEGHIVQYGKNGLKNRYKLINHGQEGR